jgi:chromatin segregation and condensation protein Rec8/ScpA/Scc1 (kleisin family)
MPLDERPLEEISLFDLMEAFQRVLESVGRDVTAWSSKVRMDTRPVSQYADRLARRLRRERSLLFSEALASLDRQEIIGTFLALLLLLKRELVVCAQEREGGAIRIIYQGDREEEPDLSEGAEEFV